MSPCLIIAPVWPFDAGWQAKLPVAVPLPGGLPVFCTPRSSGNATNVNGFGKQTLQSEGARGS